MIIQTNKFFIFRDLLNFISKCTGDQIKAFSFLFCTTKNVKSTKGGSVNLQIDFETTSKKRTDLVQDHSKEFLGNNYNNKKDFLEKPPVPMILSQ